jgi:hypothetical protein
MEVSGQRHARFSPEEIATANHFTGCRVGPGADQDPVSNSKIGILVLFWEPQF